MAALVMLYGERTLRRNGEWKDEESLFVAAETVCGNSAKARA